MGGGGGGAGNGHAVCCSKIVSQIVFDSVLHFARLSRSCDDGTEIEVVAELILFMDGAHILTLTLSCVHAHKTCIIANY